MHFRFPLVQKWLTWHQIMHFSLLLNRLGLIWGLDFLEFIKASGKAALDIVIVLLLLQSSRTHDHTYVLNFIDWVESCEFYFIFITKFGFTILSLIYGKFILTTHMKIDFGVICALKLDLEVTNSFVNEGGAVSELEAGTVDVSSRYWTFNLWIFHFVIFQLGRLNQTRIIWRLHIFILRLI